VLPCTPNIDGENIVTGAAGGAGDAYSSMTPAFTDGFHRHLCCLVYSMDSCFSQINITDCS